MQGKMENGKEGKKWDRTERKKKGWEMGRERKRGLLSNV